ncbi:MAG: multidrug efflux RND transporter permease subunit [Chthoniobacteraceae bacterium]|nr:multidrug efflux RND transporter permease subunit [Chthoniobacteraceae bacterium]
MYRFFIDRPIVAMVIAILMVLIGGIAAFFLPIAQFPKLAPPEILVKATYIGADAETVEQAVAAPVEQQMSGVDNMDYMISTNASNGQMMLRVTFDVATDPNTDQVLSQLRTSQAASQLPAEVNAYGVTIQKSPSAPLMLVALYSPKETYDSVFLANYANINLIDPLVRSPGIANINIFGAGQYAMRLWVKPDLLARLGITVPEIIAAIRSQNAPNPGGQIGAEPVPPGQSFTYTVRTQGRLLTAEEFGGIILRARPDGGVVRVRDVGRIELGAQTYNVAGRFNGEPSAILAFYQLPGTNALEAASGVKAKMAELARRFPPDIAYTVSLDTTLAVKAGMSEIVNTLVEALVLVVIVVFVFLQGWRATLIPLCAVPVSLIGTFVFFPLCGFSINTLAMFGMVLAIGVVVDDAIVVVEAVERQIEHGLAPREATLKAMEMVSGPIIGTTLVLSAVFIPTAFVPGITGRLYQQFALTIAISVAISAFNALSLSPALSALLLRPRKPARGPLGWFYRRFNSAFDAGTETYIRLSRVAIHKSVFSLLFLVLFTLAAWVLSGKIPTSFLPEEDQGYLYAAIQLPNAASLQRTEEACRKVESVLRATPGVQYFTSVAGFNLLSGVQATYNAFFFVGLQDWNRRTRPEEQIGAIQARLTRELGKIPDGTAYTFPPPAIPGVGTTGGFTFALEDRAGKDVKFLAANVAKFMEAARKRPEIVGLTTTILPAVPQVYAKVDQDKAIRQGADLAQVYQTLQTYLGGFFVNYFNRFGRQWQVYVQAEGDFRVDAESLNLFYVRNTSNQMVPLGAVTRVEPYEGPEFTTRYNLYRFAQINGAAAPGYSSSQAMQALEETFAQTMPKEMGYDYIGMSFQEKKAAQGIPPMVIFGTSLVFVFLILAALYESWSLPFSVLLGVPVAVAGALAALAARQLENDVYAQIGLVMLIGLSAKNAILIVEYAKHNYEQGQALTDAALEAARLRLRPILMTSFAFILGCVPLWTAEGSGAVSRQIIGTCVIGGMFVTSTLAIFLIPVTFCVVERIASRKPRRKEEGKDSEN